MSLFQDAAGTIPAILAGQPVGRSVRKKGSVDATQATALAKPTLARHPKSGVRNISMGAQAVNNSSFWARSLVSGGLTVTVEGTGEEDGVPYADISFRGTATSVTAVAAFAASFSTIPKVEGRSSTCRVLGKIIAGSLPTTSGFKGLRSEITEVLGGSYVAGTSGNPCLLTEYVESYCTRVEAGANTATDTRGRIVLTIAIGDVVDVTYRVKGLQWELGPNRTAFQFNRGPSDIMEPNVPDLWHLYNDGGDSLNVVLPAGEYGCAFIDTDRNVTIENVTSDGTTPINTVRVTRQLDYSIRAGAYTEIEARAIREKWSREHA